MATLSVSSIGYWTATLTSSGAGSASNTRYWYFKLTPSDTDEAPIVTRYTSNKSRSGSYDFDTLFEGMTYTAQCRYGPDLDALRKWAQNGTTANTYDGGTCYFTTKESPKTLTPTNITPTSVTLTSTGAGTPTKDRYWTFTCGNQTKTIGPNRSSTATASFSNLTAGTSYVARCRYGPSQGSTTYNGGDCYFTTTAADYTLSMSTSATASTISITATVNKTLTYDVSLTATLNGKRELDVTIKAGTTTQTRSWVSSITPATAYAIVLNDNVKGTSMSTKRRTKNNFSWSTSVVSGATFDLKASDWNEYTSQLAAKASYYGVTYNPATVSKGDTLTAEKFNNIAKVINDLVDGNKGDCVTKLNGVKKGDAVTAKAINILAQCLNE